MQIRRASCCVCGRGLQGRVEPVDRARQVHNPRSFAGPIRSENRSKPELTVLTRGGPRKELQLVTKRKNMYGYQPSCVWIPTNQMPQTGRGDRASSAATFCWLSAMDLGRRADPAAMRMTCLNTTFSTLHRKLVGTIHCRSKLQQHHRSQQICIIKTDSHLSMVECQNAQVDRLSIQGERPASRSTCSNRQG